ncbi:MAG TPA: hypothetical protein PK335_12310 [Draconibacterium sp.]|nr:hypothetical protein [Draconibacterium sp.]
MRLEIKILLVLIVAMLAGNLKAQQIKATASLDSTNILIGDQVKLFLEIDHPKSVDVTFPQVPDTIAGFIEVLGKTAVDTFEGDKSDNIKQVQAYTITCFDSGSYRIPPYWFGINTDGTVDSVPSNGVTLNVYTMQIDTTKGPADIKMPYGAPLTLKEVTPYILGVILIGAIIFFLLYSIKRKKKNQPLFVRPQKPKEPAHIVALRELDRIKDEKVWQKGKTKLYYSELTDTLRTYIEDRFEIRAMEQVTDEILDNFRRQKGLLNDKNFSNLTQLLQLADLVKFAKYEPLPDDDNLALVNAYFFVNATKKEVMKKQQDEKGNGSESNEDDNVEEVEIK